MYKFLSRTRKLGNRVFSLRLSHKAPLHVCSGLPVLEFQMIQIIGSMFEQIKHKVCDNNEYDDDDDYYYDILSTIISQLVAMRMKMKIIM